MLQAVPEPFRSIAAFIVVLGILVFVHELGHYLAARWMGVHVETFSIGFGRRIVGWTDRRGTVWRVSWIPLGGFVRLHGQERPEDVSDEDRAAWRPGRTFHEKSVGRRAVVIAAGPVANFLLAMVLFAALFAIEGRAIPLSTIGEPGKAGAGARAGLLKGDRIDSIEGARIHRFDEIRRYVEPRAGQAIRLGVHRGDSDLAVTVTPDAMKDEQGNPVGRLNVQPGDVFEFEPMSLGEALLGGVTQTWDVGARTLEGVGQMITGKVGADDLGGPLRIAEFSGQKVQQGLAAMTSFIAVLSINLGLINLFPIPILDGGHLLFYLVEALRGRPLPQRAQEYGFRAGLALLAGLFVFATWNDLSHLGLVKWVAGLIG